MKLPYQGKDLPVWTSGTALSAQARLGFEPRDLGDRKNVCFEAAFPIIFIPKQLEPLLLPFSFFFPA